jgi:hypothetical protein
MMEDGSFALIRERIPREWVVRPYHPDYGIDLAIELFEPLPERPGYASTLGEWIFAQVKSMCKLEKIQIEVFPRNNVERSALKERRDVSTTIDVATFQLETSELETVQAVGAAIPVLLLLVELSSSSVYCLCLNDYLDKILLPTDAGWRDKETKTIHVPLANEITGAEDTGRAALRFYGKRAKLFAAFQKFAYQDHELELQSQDLEDDDIGDTDFDAGFEKIRHLIAHFAQTVERYDFWRQDPVWRPIRDAREWLDHLGFMLRSWPDPFDRTVFDRLWLDPRNPQRTDPGHFCTLTDSQAKMLWLTNQIAGWRLLANLGRMYEEVCREWNLPSFLSKAITPYAWET